MKRLFLLSLLFVGPLVAMNNEENNKEEIVEPAGELEHPITKDEEFITELNAIVAGLQDLTKEKTEESLKAAQEFCAVCKGEKESIDPQYLAKLQEVGLVFEDKTNVAEYTKEVYANISNPVLNGEIISIAEQKKNNY